MNDHKATGSLLFLCVFAMPVAGIVVGFASIVKPDDPLWFYALNALFMSLGVFYIPQLLFVSDADKRDFGCERISAKTVPVCVLLGVSVFLVTSSVNTLASMLYYELDFGLVPPSPALQPDFSGWRIVGTAIAACIVPAVAEEQFFRGYLINAWRASGRAKAVLVTSALFALMHCDFMSMPALFIAGVAIGLVAFDTHSVYPAMIMHLVNNLLSYTVYCLSASDNPVSSAAQSAAEAVSTVGSGAVGTTTWVLISAYIVVGTVLFLFMYKRIIRMSPAALAPQAEAADEKPRILCANVIVSFVLLVIYNVYTSGVLQKCL